MRGLLVIIAVLGGCAPSPEDYDVAPKGCVPLHEKACTEIYAACLESSACKKPWFDFEPPATCRATCVAVKRDCHRRCPIWPPPKVPEAFKPYPQA